MNNRIFPTSVQFETVKANLEKNSGRICCESCGKNLSSVSECHFDHIVPYSKGGKSVVTNCQILCVDCNLKKSNKELEDFAIEEKARRFLKGEALNTAEITETKNSSSSSTKITREIFDNIVYEYIKEKGSIHKVDFTREYNNLPSITYVSKYYGSIGNLQKAFGIVDMSFNWNRENIKEALLNYASEHGDISQTDLKKCNGLPSVPCILNNYPEYKSWTDIKRDLCGLSVREQWTKEKAITAGKEFLRANKRDYISEKDMRSCNNLPTMKVIYDHFGSMNNYQIEIGSKLSKVNTFVSKEDISKAVNEYFGSKERVIVSRKDFTENFVYGQEVIYKRYGSFENFYRENNIHVLNKKKARYTRQEVDSSIKEYISRGNPIPIAKDLTKCGLPSMSTIMKYYENWKEPFVLYENLYKK